MDLQGKEQNNRRKGHDSKIRYSGSLEYPHRSYGFHCNLGKVLTMMRKQTMLDSLANTQDSLSHVARWVYREDGNHATSRKFLRHAIRDLQKIEQSLKLAETKHGSN